MDFGSPPTDYSIESIGEKNEESDSDDFGEYPHINIPDSIESMLRDIAEEWESADTDPRDFDTDDYGTANFVGLSGEWAFSSYYGLDFSPIIGQADDGQDYTVCHRPSEKQLTIDVKTITFESGDLLVRARRKIDCDIYFLCEKRGDTVALIGRVPKEVVENATIHEAGEYSPVRVRRIPREKLNPIFKPRSLVSST